MVNKDDYGQHISQQFNSELEEVRSHFLAMGGLVEKQVADSIASLLDADSRLAEEVQANDKKINKMETQIDEELVRILARRQPAASDLRFIIAIGKSITDLERIGDEAAKVARYALALVEEGESPRGYVEARHIGNQVRVMLHDALDAFARFDADLAFEVMQADSSIDTEYKTAMRALMTYMMEDPRAISRVLNVMWVLRSLERIGDHARNISEQLIFLVKGADVRHTSYDQVRQRLNEKK
ncbi:MAG: phosphate signaling complex protein PhoU [Moraxellaceae bacterium]